MMMKKITIATLIAFCSFSNIAFAADKLEKLTLAGPFAAVSDPLIRMMNIGALDDVAKKTEFKIWKNPDQMRALALRGDVDFIASPTNVAANLYNRGADIRLLNVSIWGVLWMVSRDDTLKTIADFKGKEIAMPFRADMPDIIFSKLAEESGLDPKKDFKIRYVSNPFDAMQMWQLLIKTWIDMLSSVLWKNTKRQPNGVCKTRMKLE